VFSNSNYQCIRYEEEGAIATLTLNRPDKLNAINSKMIDELNQALDSAESDEGVRVIVLAGTGDTFSAGFDLYEGEGQASTDTEFWKKELRRYFDIIMRFWDSPKSTIAAVHKYCLGSAMEMAVACDITIAETGCRFGVPEAKFGSGIVSLSYPGLLTSRLPRNYYSAAMTKSVQIGPWRLA
jgi:enoyl-CoA hydratase